MRTINIPRFARLVFIIAIVAGTGTLIIDSNLSTKNFDYCLDYPNTTVTVHSVTVANLLTTPPHYNITCREFVSTTDVGLVKVWK